MSSKTVLIGSLFLAGALAPAEGTAHAVNINTDATACQSLQGSLVQNIYYSAYGVANIAEFVVPVICSVPRSPLAPGAPARFYIDGSNANGSTTLCTLYVFDYLGVYQISKTVTLAGTASDALVMFAPGEVGDYDYVNVICTLPAHSGGNLRGITSVQ